MEITLQQVSKRYRYEWIFKGIDYQLVPGGRYAVTGERLKEEIIERFIIVSNAKSTYMLGLLEQMTGEWDAWRYAWDMDPARRMTSTGRWKDTQEMKGLGS